MKIAAIYTCFNRKSKTLASLKSVFDAVSYYNDNSADEIELFVFLTDDGCTDGTSDAIQCEFSNHYIKISKSKGDLFWARGMCLSWNEARKNHDAWDYYLLLNDDTVINPNCFDELFRTNDYCVKTFGKQGVVSGLTCDPKDPSVITYGGDVILNKFNGNSVRLGRSSHPQLVDITNANILLVPRSVVDKIGIFYDGYKHGWADNDYSLLARRKNIPVLITADACGTCDNDHVRHDELKAKIKAMSLKQRIAYYNHPLHSTSDYLKYVWRNMPFRLPLSWLFRTMLTYTPELYFKINEKRGV